jgi:hypothetical protein
MKRTFLRSLVACAGLVAASVLTLPAAHAAAAPATLTAGVVAPDFTMKNLAGADVRLAAAYGDTDGDWEMLDMAEENFMRLFSGKPVPTVGAP